MQDLNDTLVFVEVVSQGSFTAAARELRLPKSTVSRRIQDLEARLGVQLLHRTTRKLGLTEAGSVYFDCCREIGRVLERAEHAVVELQSGPRGWLRVASSPTVAGSWVAPLLGEFHARFPEVRVEMQLTDEKPDLIGSELDIALYSGPLPDSGLVARRLAVFETHVYASPQYLRRFGEPRHAEQLVEHRTLALSCHRRDSRYQWDMSNGEVSGSYPIDPMLVCNDASLLQAPLLAGEGLTLACAFSMRRHLASGAVRRLMAGWRGPTLALSAVFPRGRAMSPKLRVFIDFLVERLESARGAGGVPA